MRRKDLLTLQCPYCSAPFKSGSLWPSNVDQVEYGSVYCLCDEFPIVAGILFLQKPKCREVLDFLRQKDTVGAQLVCITEQRRYHPDRPWMKLGGRAMLGRLLAPDFLRQMGKVWATRLVSFVMPSHLLKYYFTRDQWQDALAIVLPLAVLLEKQKRGEQRRVVWLDLGSGLVNFFGEMQSAWKKLQIVSVDKNYLLLYLSAVFYPGKDVVRVCGDAHFCQVVRPQTADVVTVVDTLQSLSSPATLLQQLLLPGWLKKDSQLFVSGLQEHHYLPRDWGILPAPRVIPLHIFRSYPRTLPAPVLFDNEALSAQITAGSVDVQLVCRTKTQPVFSYGFWWSEGMRLPKKLSTTFLPEAVRQRATLTWDDPTIQWSNEAY